MARHDVTYFIFKGTPNKPTSGTGEQGKNDGILIDC